MIYKECNSNIWIVDCVCVCPYSTPKSTRLWNVVQFFFFSIKICVDTVFLKKSYRTRIITTSRAIYKSASGFLSDQDLEANVAIFSLACTDLRGDVFAKLCVVCVCVEFWYLAWYRAIQFVVFYFFAFF